MLAKTKAEAMAKIQEEWKHIEARRQELLQAQKVNQDQLAVLEAKFAKQAAMMAKIQGCQKELEKRHLAQWRSLRNNLTLNCKS